MQYVPLAKRNEVNIAAMFGSTPFYEGLHASVEAGIEAVLCSAKFLALDAFHTKALPVPTRRAANGTRVQDMAEEFEWFRERFAGEIALSADQHQPISVLAKNAYVISSWLGSAASTSDDPLLHAVLRSAFTSNELRSIPVVRWRLIAP